MDLERAMCLMQYVLFLGKSGAKGLRAEKTANLIYNGGKRKQPATKAEVSIFFDNEKKIISSEILKNLKLQELFQKKELHNIESTIRSIQDNKLLICC
jgi:chromosome segregation ATPase